MSLKDNGYQKNVAQKKIDPLTSFLENIQCRQGVKQKYKPHLFSEDGKKRKTLDRFLIEAEAEKELAADDAVDLGSDEAPADDQVQAAADNKETAADNAQFYIGANQRYFMGAGTDPLLTIVTQVGDDKIKYYQYPWKKEQVIKKDIGQELMKKGCETWLAKNSDSTEEDLKKSIEAVLAGKPGEKVTLEDYQFANIQVRYTGSEKGDEAPWQELEQKYNVNVGGVLANKQTYNVRLTNRSLQKFEDELRQAEPEERKFKIVKIMKEEEDLMVECGVFPMAFGMGKPKPSIKEVPVEELEYLKKQIEYGLRNDIVNGDWKIGETVSYDDGQWIIAEFIPWLKELAVLLVSIDNMKMADQVPIKKIRKLTPEELSGLRCKEEFVKGKKQIVLDLPASGPDGETKDIAKELKIKKVKKEKKNLTESLFEDKVEDLADFIDNDAETYKKDFSPAAKNLTNKWNDGSYNRELALNSFKQIAESASKRYFVSHDGEYEGQSFDNEKQIFPEDIIMQVAKVLRKSFENQAKVGMISEVIEQICEGGVITKHNKPKPDEEASDDGKPILPSANAGASGQDSDSLSIGAPFSEQEAAADKKPVMKGQTSTVKENIPFTDNEKKALREASSKVKIEVLNNAATLSWEGSDGLVKVTITKNPQPQQKNFVYAATSKIDNDLDKERTTNSETFETEDDVDVLKNFLASLKINEEQEFDEARKVWGEPTVRVKYVNAYPIRNEKAIKSEVIGNVRFQYKLVSDIKEHKPKMKSKKKSGRKEKKHPTEVKIVSNYPIVDGKQLKSQTIGNVTYRYKTKADKKEEAEERRAKRKSKGKKTKKLHEDTEIPLTLVSAGKDNAVIRIEGKEEKIKRYQSFETPTGHWTYTEYYSPLETDENKAAIVITKVGSNNKTQIQTIEVGETINV